MFLIEIRQFLNGQWVKLDTIEMTNDVTTLEAAAKNLSDLTEAIHKAKTMFFVKETADALIISLEHGPINLRVFRVVI